MEQLRRVQSENYQLRAYIIVLQSRLLETAQDLPVAPDNIDFTQGAIPGGVTEDQTMVDPATGAATQVSVDPLHFIRSYASVLILTLKNLTRNQHGRKTDISQQAHLAPVANMEMSETAMATLVAVENYNRTTHNGHGKGAEDDGSSAAGNNGGGT